MKRWMAMLPAQLPAGDSALLCWQYALDGQVHTQACSSAQLAAQTPGVVDVVVPAALLSWHQVHVPLGLRLRGDARLLPVLQNLLEDVLLQSPQELHLALSAQAQSGQPCVVAVCSLAWLQAWLAQLDQVGVKVGKILPQVPPDVAGTSAWCTGQAHAGWCTSVQDGLPLTTPLEPGAAPLHTVDSWYAEPAVYSDAQRCSAAAPVQLWQPWDMLQALLRSEWNLAQHTLASTHAQRWRRKVQLAAQQLAQGPAWRSARWGAAMALLVMVLGVQTHTWQQRRSLQHKQAQVQALAQQTFPQLTLVVNAPVQMQRALQGLQQAAGQLVPTDFEPLAAAAGRALQAGGLQAVALEYAQAQLRVRVATAGPLPLPAMQQALQGSGYRVQALGSDQLQLEWEGR